MLAFVLFVDRMSHSAIPRRKELVFCFDFQSELEAGKKNKHAYPG